MCPGRPLRTEGDPSPPHTCGGVCGFWARDRPPSHGLRRECPGGALFLVLSLFIRLIPTHPSEIVGVSLPPGSLPWSRPRPAPSPGGAAGPVPGPPKLPVKALTGSVRLPHRPSAQHVRPSPPHVGIIYSVDWPLEPFRYLM